MIYLFIYLALGVITLIICWLCMFFIDRLDQIDLEDVLISAVCIPLWPIYACIAWQVWGPSISWRLTLDWRPSSIVLWRRKTGTESPAPSLPNSPPSSNDPDI